MICDLDETVLSVNSFRPWVRYLIMGHFGEMKTAERLELSCYVIWAMIERKLLKKDHAVIKGKLQKFWTQATVKDPAGLAQDWLLSDLASTVRPNLRSFLQWTAAGKQSVLLATAAAGEYAAPLAARIGFRHVLATPPLYKSKEPAKEHNAGEVKRDNVLAYLKTQGWDASPRVFLTDHNEDKPLIAVCDKILWFGKEPAMQALQKEFPDKVFVHALVLEPREVLEQVATAAAIIPPPPSPEATAEVVVG